MVDIISLGNSKRRKEPFILNEILIFCLRTVAQINDGINVEISFIF